MDTLTDAFGLAQQWLFEGLLQPLMFHLGLGNLLADGYRATGWLLVGLLLLALMLTLMRALERWRPAEPPDVLDSRGTSADIVSLYRRSCGPLERLSPAHRSANAPAAAPRQT